MELGRDRVAAEEFSKRIEAQGIDILSRTVARENILRSMDIVHTNSKGNYYSYAMIRQNQRESE